MDPIYVLSTTLIKQLVNSYLELRKTQKEEDLSSDRWLSLESAYFEHLKWRFEYPAGVFRQQAITGWLITILVIALIISGLSFSFIQLQYATSIGDLSSFESQIEIETAGRISVSSSIVGAIVLVISLGFFYLYLSHVFRIQYPVPPHVRLGETDIWSLLKNRSQKTNISMPEILEVLEKQKPKEEINKVDEQID